MLCMALHTCFPPSWRPSMMLTLAACLLCVVHSMPSNPAVVTLNLPVDYWGKPQKFDAHKDLVLKFSRPMLALGAGAHHAMSQPATLHPKVEGGHWAWIDPAVLRFRPSPQFDTDVNYTVKLKDGITDVYGVAFEPKITSWSFVTQDNVKYQLIVQRVLSEKASELTSGVWNEHRVVQTSDPAKGAEAEVPPDGKVLVAVRGLHAFNLDGSDSSWTQSFRMEKQGSSEILEVTARPCPEDAFVDDDSKHWHDPFCAEITPKKALEADTIYDIVLPKGTEFRSKANTVELPYDVVTRVRGLCPFTFPFPATSNDNMHIQPVDMENDEPPIDLKQKYGARLPEKHFLSQRLALRHGLDEAVTMDALVKQFELDPKVEGLALRKVNKGYVELSGKFMPGQTYRLVVKANDDIKDGYGLPLKTSNTSFRMAELQPVLRSPEFNPRSGVFVLKSASNSVPPAWPVLFRGKGLCMKKEGEVTTDECDVMREEVFEVKSMPDVKAAVDALNYYSGGRNTTTMEKKYNMPAPLEDGASIKTSTIQGTQLHTRWGQENMKPVIRPIYQNSGASSTRWQASDGSSTGEWKDKTHFMVTETDLVVQFLRWGTHDPRLLMWVLRQVDGQLVPASNVKYHLFRGPGHDPGNTRLMDVDKDGVGALQFPQPRGGDGDAHIQPASNVQVEPRSMLQDFGSRMFVALYEGESSIPVVVRVPPPREHIPANRPNPWERMDTDVNGNFGAGGSAALRQMDGGRGGGSSGSGIEVDPVRHPVDPLRESQRWQVLLITDRPAYLPEDTIYIKGYIRDVRSFGAGSMADACKALGKTVRVQAGFNVEANPEVSHEYCSFATQIQIPRNASYGRHTLSVSPGVDERGFQGYVSDIRGDGDIVVVDPRKPTAHFHVKCPACEEVNVPLTSENDVEIALSGGFSLVSQEHSIQLNGADITISWRIFRACDEMGWNVRRWNAWSEDGISMCQQMDERGNVAMKARTDQKGEFHATWKATEQLPNTMTLMAGDIITFSFKGWLSSKNDASQGTYEEKHSVFIGQTNESLRIHVPHVDVLPQVPFQATVSMRSLQRLGGDPLPGRQFKVSLYESKSSKGALHNAKLADLPVGKLIQECPDAITTGSDGLAHACSLKLPEMGQFLVTACDATLNVCSALRVGKTEAQWEELPLLHFLPQVVQFSLDKKEYNVGDKVVVSFNNPRPKSVALVAWGSSPHTQQVTIEDAKEKAEITLEHLTDKDGSCAHGCRIVVVLVAPANAANTVPVPHSHLFDPSMPEYASKTLRVVVHSDEHPAPQTLSLRVDLPLPADAGHHPSPFSSQPITVELKDENGKPASGEVCIFAVDKTMLSVKDHKMADFSYLTRQPHFVDLDDDEPNIDPRLDIGFAPGPYSRGSKPQMKEVHVKSNIDRFVSASVLKNVTNWMTEIMALDPYLLDYVRWPLRPDDELAIAGAFYSWWKFHHMVVDAETSIEKVKDSFYGLLTQMDGGIGGEPYHEPYHAIEDWDQLESGEYHLGPVYKEPYMDASGSSNSKLGRIWMEGAPWRMDPVVDSRLHQRYPDLRAETVVSPMFHTIAVENGVASSSMTIPASSSLEIRAYAVGKGPESFASAVTETRIPLYVKVMETLPPRVRIGDKFEGGIIFSRAVEDSTGNQKQSYRVELVDFVDGPLKLRATESLPKTRTADLIGNQAVRVDFAMEAQSLGSQKVVIKVIHLFPDNGYTVDQVEATIDVLGPRSQMHVTLADDILGTAENSACVDAKWDTTAAFRNGGGSGATSLPCPWSEGIALPNMLNVSHLKLRMGPSFLPVVKSLFDDFHHLQQAIDDPLTGNHLSVIELLGAFASYAVQAPPMRVEAIGQKLEELATGLVAMSSHDYNQGVHYSSWATERYWGMPDLHLNAAAAVVMRRLQSGVQGISSMLYARRDPRSEAAGGDDATTLRRKEGPVGYSYVLSRSVAAPSKAVTVGLVWIAASNLIGDLPKDSEYWDTVALARLAKGASWSFGGEAKEDLVVTLKQIRIKDVDSERLETASTLDMSSLKDPKSDYSPFARAAAAVNILLGKDVEDSLLSERLLAQGCPEDAEGLLLALSAYLQVGHHTAYVVKSRDDHDSASLLTNSLVLEALALRALAEGAKADQGPLAAMHEQMFKIARHVTEGVAEAGRSAAGIFAAIALADLDQWVAMYSNQQWDNLVAKVMSPALPADKSMVHRMEQMGNVESFAPVERFVEYDLMKRDDMASLKSLGFQLWGHGQATAVVSARFVPRAMPSKPLSKGFVIERAIMGYNVSKHETVVGAVTEIPLGQVVKVIIHVHSPVNIPGLVIEESTPGGLEVFHHGLTPGTVNSEQEDHCVGNKYDARRVWSPCTNWFTENKGDRTVRHTAHLSAGSHSFSYFAMAATKGKFYMPPVVAWGVMDASVRAQTGEETLRVLDADQKLQEGSALPVPKECSHDCKGRGVCDTSTGECQCFSGFIGEDCSNFASRQLVLKSARTLLTYLSMTGGAEQTTVRSWDMPKDPVEIIEELHYINVIAGNTEVLYPSAPGGGALQALNVDVFSDSFPSDASWMSKIERDAVTDALLGNFKEELLTINTDNESVTIKAADLDASFKAGSGFGAFLVLSGTVDGHIIAKARVKLQIFKDCVPALECKGDAPCKPIPGKCVTKELAVASGFKLFQSSNNILIIALIGVLAAAVGASFLAYKHAAKAGTQPQMRGSALSNAPQDGGEDGYGKMNGFDC